MWFHFYLTPDPGLNDYYVSTAEHPNIGSVPALLSRVEPRRKRSRRHARGKLHNPRSVAAEVEVFLSVHVHRAKGRVSDFYFVGGKRQSENQAYDNTSNYTYATHSDALRLNQIERSN
jgi:hypothetical protein